MSIECDPAKAQLNFKKHGISFDVAKAVFEDPHRIEVYDDRDYGEERWAVIGRIGKTLVYVVYTERDGGVRLIAARKADQDDESDYIQSLL